MLSAEEDVPGRSHFTSFVCPVFSHYGYLVPTSEHVVGVLPSTKIQPVDVLGDVLYFVVAVDCVHQ